MVDILEETRNPSSTAYKAEKAYKTEEKGKSKEKGSGGQSQ